MVQSVENERMKKTRKKLLSTFTEIYLKTSDYERRENLAFLMRRVVRTDEEVQALEELLHS